MPIPTRPPPPPPPLPPPLPSPPASSRCRAIAAVLAFAAGAALVELLAGLFLGAFPLTFRAEAHLFLLFRPWAILLLALALGQFGWRRRVAGYAAFLLLAGAGEALYMLRLGNPNPWAEMLRGWGAGALVAIAADLLLGLARRRGRRWAVAAAAGIAAPFALPAVQSGWSWSISPPAPAVLEEAAQPEVLLMSALPLVWGETGPFDPNARRPALYEALDREFNLRPVDELSNEALAGKRLLLLIQPRWLAPSELVALDQWVRGGGRALILTDPRLNWHSELALGDIRRPPPVGLLKPLLDHWGLALEEGRGGRAVAKFGRERLLHMESPGRLAPRGADCRFKTPYLAECRLGTGRALVLADADLVRDELWAAPGADAADRNRRLSDNSLVLGDLLDDLLALDRPRAAGDVRWRDLARPPTGALLWALLPLLAITLVSAVAALLPARRGGRSQQTYPQA